jgi:hypothetical protein
VDLPLSQPIQPLIDRINWQYKDKIRFANWGSRLYVAVPLDDAASRKYIPPTRDTYSGLGIVEFPNLTRYATYYWEKGNATALTSPNPDLTESGYFAATGATIPELPVPVPVLVPFTIATGEAGRQVTTRIAEETSGVNNTILVYDFLTQQWTPRDTGSALTVKEFFKAPYNGVERLFFISEDGFVNLMEEAEAGDQVYDANAATLLRWEEITTRVRTRGYVAMQRRVVDDNLVTMQKVEEVMAVLGTWNPRYSVKLIFDGANESQEVDADGETICTKDGTKYYRPFTAEDYDTTNVNGDHAVPYRQDYSVALGAGGLYLAGGGVQLHLMQETLEVMDVTPQAGRTVQVEITNYRGRVALRAVEVDSERIASRKGSYA